MPSARYEDKVRVSAENVDARYEDARYEDARYEDVVRVSAMYNYSRRKI